jgi:leucine-rich repeat protein SHOC2
MNKGMSKKYIPQRVQEQLTLALTTGVIDFCGNLLSDIPEQILENELIYVTQLRFSGNRLNELSTFITRLPSLQVLDLSGNVLQLLPPQIGLLSELRVLKLNGNPLKELPRSLGMLENSLQELSFDPDVLKWPCSQEVFGSTRELLHFLSAFHTAELDSILDLSAGRWNEIPEEVYFETSLECLKLSNNQIHSLKPALESLQCLQELWLDSNSFQGEMPVALNSLTNLTILNLHGNSIRRLSSDLPFSKLKEFRVSDNALEGVPSSLGKLRLLQLLDISFNQISLLPSEIGQCASLKTFRARGNRIRVIPEDFSKIPQLEELSVDHNPLVRLPIRVATMNTLKKLQYDIDNLQSPPLVVASRGSEYTLHYMRLLSAAFQRGKLTLDNSFLDRIPVEVCELSTLTSLSLSHNDVSIIPPQIVLLMKLEIVSASLTFACGHSYHY